LLELIDRKEVHKLTHDNDMLARFEVATQIVRGLAHEIKNPLGGIRGAAQLLALETDKPEIQEYSTVITREVDRLSDLLNRMSGGNTSLERSWVDIHEPLTHIASLLKAEHGEELELIYNFDTSLPMLELHFDQLKQALFNLMQNAVQWSIMANPPSASQQQAVIEVSTRAAYPDLMRSLMPQQGIRIQIQDNGPGVDPTIVEQLFLPMVTRREGGTGLGLSISQEIAQSHGGFIELDELPAYGGASFSLYLPFHTEQEGA
jgi:two-component system nitrogen regulation sensor histidine kinase GlnL